MLVAKAWARAAANVEPEDFTSAVDLHKAAAASTAARQAHEELSRSGEAGYEPKLLTAGFKPGQGATTTPSRSIVAFLKSGGQPRTHSRSGRQSDLTHDEQQAQEELDAFYEWREPNSTEHHRDRLQTTPLPTMHNDKRQG